jgi:formate--tetrahydrofolate ligase
LILRDIEIAQAARPLDIMTVADKLGIPAEFVERYGNDKAKLGLPFLASLDRRRQGKLILVTAISPTPAGEGKTTTTIGLGDALSQIGEKAVICLREPSMGPVFGQKGCATGGGRAQVLPMEDINLHFTGDFAAVGQAHNLLAALLDNHVQQGNTLDIDPRRIVWRRVLDSNDRSLRQIVIGLGGPASGVPREDGFDIIAASEVMAILCLTSDLADLKRRLSRIVVAYTRSNQAVTAGDLKAAGAMAALLKHAIKPNLVQTLEGNPALIHGGPFANIAHGCNSLMATRAGLGLADYVVTEAGFGSDLGAEKFLDIKCRKAGLFPAAVVVVSTLRALKYHGGTALADVSKPDIAALERGLVNLDRHVANITDVFGLPCVVAVNHFSTDTDAEIDVVRRRYVDRNVRVVLARHWAEGGAGAVDLAREIVRMTKQDAPKPRFTYDGDLPLADKIRTVARRIYGAADIALSAKLQAQLAQFEREGFGHLPVCMAKTQMSFSTDAKARGAPSGHIVNVRELRLAAGAEFIVAICGDLLTMPGLPRVPSAESIDIDADGRISGLH